MYNPSITPEAARDLSSLTGFDNPKRKYEHASLMDYEVDGVKHQALTFHYSVEGVDYTKVTPFCVIQIPISNVIEMLKYAMTTIAGAHELTEGYR